MVKRSHIAAIRELAESEGVFTAAQAAALGVPRDALSYAASHGSVERVAHGAYRLAGSRPGPWDELAALWKLTAPAVPSAERVRRASWDGVCVAGATAASVLGMGDFEPAPYRILAPRRINSRRANARFGVRAVARDDVTFAEGFPVTRPERIVVDLLLDDEDPSLVLDAYRDARRRGIDVSRLGALLASELPARRLPEASELLGLSPAPDAGGGAR